MANNHLFQLKQLCIKDKIPIMRDKTLKALSKLAKNKNVLEIGTGYGYSSLYLWNKAKPRAITTLEKNNDSFKKAVFFLKNTSIIVHNVSAFDWNPKNKQYDLLVIDGPKSKQVELFKKYFPHINKNGYIFIDNINLFSEVKSLTTRQKKLKQKVEMFKLFLKQLNPKKFNVKFFDIEDGYSIIKII